jgi:hypothetical protein
MERMGPPRIARSESAARDLLSIRGAHLRKIKLNELFGLRGYGRDDDGAARGPLDLRYVVAVLRWATPVATHRKTESYTPAEMKSISR